MAITLYIESVSVDAVNLKWLDSVAPTQTHAIWRSEDGVSYDLVDTAIASDVDYTDSGLLPETRYWYKIINESATESSAKSVITQTCFGLDVRTVSPIALPTADGEVTDDQFNDAMRRLESIIRTQSDGHDCVICSSDGAIVLNCAEGCRDFNISVTEDINSISIIGCEDAGDGHINFKIPAGETWRVCGFPSNFGFSGNECFDAPLSGGTNGRTVGVGFCGNSTGVRANTPSGTGGSGTGGTGSGGGGGGGALTVTCQTNTGAANSTCSMACGSDNAMRLRVTGGRPPYTFSTNSGGTFSTVNSNTKKIVPPTNSGSGVAGNAYRKFVFHKECSNSCNNTDQSTYGCNDTTAGCINISPTSNDKYSASPTCAVNQAVGTQMTIIDHGASSGHTPCNSQGTFCDMRSAGMISGGCNPCGTSMPTKTVTVTDADGVSVVKVITG